MGIFAIYLGHFGDAAGRFYLFVFAYHVPLFFFAGGFFAEPKKEETYFAYIKKMTKNILLPYYFFQFICIIVTTIYERYEAHAVFNLIYEGLLRRRNHVGSTWFLTCFFIISILYRGLLLILKNKYLVFAVSYLLYMFSGQICVTLKIEPLSLMYNLDSAIYYLVYFAAGHCLFKYINRWVSSNPLWGGKHTVPKMLFSLILTVITAIVYFADGAYFLRKLSLSGYASSFGVFIQTLLLIFFNCMIAYFIVKLPLICKLGQNTLVLCGFEGATKMILPAFQAAVGLSTNLVTPLTACIYTFFCLAACYAMFVIGVRKITPDISNLWRR